MSLYMFCVLYTREELLDGFVPEEVALSAWGRPETERGPQVEALMSVDLLERVEGGFRVVKYAEHNDTAQDVATNRDDARDRMRKSRAKRRGADAVTCDTTVTGDVGYAPVTCDSRVTHTFVPISISLNSSDLSSGSLTHASERAGETDTPPTLAPLGDAAPPWWGVAVETVEANTGLRISDRAGAWLEYRASRERKHWAPSQRDATGWLAAVARSEASRSRERRSGPELTKQAVDLSAPWMRAAMGGDT
jgi:hypothetical protein